MTLKSGTGSACAVCKYQRRKCSPACVLAPYFPADQPDNFRNAHRLFGVSNIVELLKMLDDSQKADAMNSIIYQAYIRERYPVHGCLGVILQLNCLIWHKEKELHAVQSQLDMHRQQNQLSNLTEEVPSQLELGMAPPCNDNDGRTLFTSPHNNLVNVLPDSHRHPFSNIRYSSSGYLDTKDSVGSSFIWDQNQYVTNSNNANSMAVSQQMATIQQEVVQDYDEMLPLFDTIYDRQSYIDSKEAYDSSSEESLKDTTQSVEYVAENELKSAAACFSLTSVRRSMS